MKKIAFLLMAALFTTAVSFGQIRKIPASATANFKQKYPQATNVEWDSGLTNYSATFEQNGVKYYAKFNNKGEWVSTEHDITASDLPAPVTEGLKKSKYADWKPGNFVLIQLPNDQVQYRMQVVKSDIQKKNLLFSSDGRLLKDNITL